MKIKLKQEGANSSIQLIVSLIFVLMGVWFYFDKLKDKPEIDVFDWSYIAFFSILFVVFLVKGVIGFLKYPFVEIDDEAITYLSDINDFPTTIQWDNVTQIEINPIAIFLHKKAGEPLGVSLNTMSDKSETELLDMLHQIAQKRNISVVK